MKAYGKFRHSGPFKSSFYRKSAPAAPTIRQTREKAFAITVKFKAAGLGRGTVLSYDQFETFLKQAVRPWFKNHFESTFRIVKDYHNGLVTFAVWPEDYKDYGTKLFTNIDNEGQFPVSIHGHQKRVTTLIKNVEPCYVYLPFLHYF